MLCLVHCDVVDDILKDCSAFNFRAKQSKKIFIFLLGLFYPEEKHIMLLQNVTFCQLAWQNSKIFQKSLITGNAARI